MNINETSLIGLRDFILNKTKYNTGSMVMTFFSRFGYYDNYFVDPFYNRHGNKWEYCLFRLRELNNQNRIKEVLLEAVNPINFISNYELLDEFIAGFNKLLRYDDYMLVRCNDRVMIVTMYNVLKQFSSFVDMPKVIIGKLPQIEKLRLLESYNVHIYLKDGYDFIFDFTPHLEYKCNQALKDISLFKQVKVKHRMIYWNDEYEIHLDQMLPDEYRQHIR